MLRPIVILGHPPCRRVAMFTDAMKRLGGPPPAILPWVDVIDDPEVLARIDAPDVIFRIESPGPYPEVERALLRRGWPLIGPEGTAMAPGAYEPRHGRIAAPRQRHLGFLSVLDDLERHLAQREGWRVPTPPALIRLCFDKAACWRRCVELDLPVCPALPRPVASLAQLLEQMHERDVEQVFVKMTSGSSASCLALVSSRGPRALTTVEMASDGFYNSRRLRTYVGRDLERLIAFLLGEGAHIEHAVPKARLRMNAQPWYFDLRVLAIQSAPVFTVVRQSPYPITNLHLGGQRGDFTWLRAKHEALVVDIHDSVRKLSRALSAFHLGVDVLVEPGFQTHRLIEANAFGDLLPNLRIDGHDVYETQILRFQEETSA